MTTASYREFQVLLAARRKAGRRLIVATDHGLSFTQRGLTHGTGGVFARAVFRCEWDAE